MPALRLTLKKVVHRSLNDELLNRQLGYVVKRAVHGSRFDKGWRATVGLTTHEKKVDTLGTRKVTEIITSTNPDQAPVERTREVDVNRPTFAYFAQFDVVYVPRRSRKSELLNAEVDHVYKQASAAARTNGWEVVMRQDISEEEALRTNPVLRQRIEEVIGNRDVSDVVDATPDLVESINAVDGNGMGVTVSQ